MSLPPLTEEERLALKARVQRERSFWGPMHECMYRLDARFLDTYLRFVTPPSSLISHKLRHLIFVAVDASVTHLYAKGITLHADIAMRAGATREEVFAVLKLMLEFGALPLKSGLPILREELARQGLPAPAARALTAQQQEAKSRFTEQVGHWPQWLDELMQTAPALAESLIAAVQAPWDDGVLDRKSMALILVAAHAAPTAMHEPSMREFIRLALHHGASAEEITEVLQLAGSISMHAISVGAPLLVKLTEGEDISTYHIGNAP